MKTTINYEGHAITVTTENSASGIPVVLVDDEIRNVHPADAIKLRDYCWDKMTQAELEAEVQRIFFGGER